MSEISGSIATLGAGLVTIGAGLGIGKLAASAMEAIARQPEMAAKIQASMLIAAAMIEGIALFGAVICYVAR
jgi:F-type H+-transporting ATPase subunit c